PIVLVANKNMLPITIMKINTTTEILRPKISLAKNFTPLYLKTYFEFMLLQTNLGLEKCRISNLLIPDGRLSKLLRHANKLNVVCTGRYRLIVESHAT
ncbi:MAG TPA: hypothetical protein QF359_13515, partial [Rhodospirillales bacterium]|nr:hypothetical protein [Rhodospirillales bacterium]